MKVKEVLEVLKTADPEMDCIMVYGEGDGDDWCDIGFVDEVVVGPGPLGDLNATTVYFHPSSTPEAIEIARQRADDFHNEWLKQRGEQVVKERPTGV